MLFPVCVRAATDGFELSLRDWTVLSNLHLCFALPRMSAESLLWRVEETSEPLLSSFSVPDWPVLYSYENYHPAEETSLYFII